MSAIALTLHLFAALIWVGGMFFAFMAVRPALGSLDTLVRARVWAGIFARFFPWVWAAIGVLLVSGFYMVRDSFDGLAHAPLFVHIMMGLGILMMLLFGHVFFAPYKRLKRAVSGNDEALAGKAMGQIRMIMLVNLSLGLIVVGVAMLGTFVASD